MDDVLVSTQDAHGTPVRLTRNSLTYGEEVVSADDVTAIMQQPYDAPVKKVSSLRSWYLDGAALKANPRPWSSKAWNRGKRTCLLACFTPYGAETGRAKGR